MPGRSQAVGLEENMNYRRLSDTDLAQFAKNIFKRLSSGALSCFDQALSDQLAAELGPECEAFAADLSESLELRSRLASVNARKREHRTSLIDRLASVSKHMRSKGASGADHDLCGFTFRKGWTRIMANDPADLVVTGMSNGVNVVSFDGNNTSQVVKYEIWRRGRGDKKWAFLGNSSRQTYFDQPVVPGDFYEYKVRAIGSHNESNWSNVGSVYPMR